MSCVLIGFSDNGIGNEGAKALGDSLKTHTIMKKLDIGCEIHLISFLCFNATQHHNHSQQDWQ